MNKQAIILIEQTDPERYLGHPRPEIDAQCRSGGALRHDRRRPEQSVKRNLQRFYADFVFELTAEETENLRFQIGSQVRTTDVRNFRLQTTREENSNYEPRIQFRNHES
jgi:hypothetical protein